MKHIRLGLDPEHSCGWGPGSGGSVAKFLRQAPLPVGFPGQAHWSGLSFPSPGNLPDSGVDPTAPALAGGLFPTEPPGKGRGPTATQAARSGRAEGEEDNASDPAEDRTGLENK